MLGVTLVPIVHFYGPKEVGFILRQSGARALIIVSKIGQRDYLAELATIRDGLDDSRQVVVVGDIAGDGVPDYVPFDDLRRAEPIDGPAPVDPDTPAVIGYTSGTTADPKGVVHTHRTLGCEVRQLTEHQANARPCRASSARRSAMPSGCSAACSARSSAGNPIYMIDGWDPPTVLDAMLEEDIAAGSGVHLFLHEPARLPRLQPRARRADALHRARWLAHPRRGGRAGGRARDLAGPLLRSHRAPLDHRLPARRPQGEAHPHRRPADGRGSRSAPSTRTGNDVGVGEPGEILEPRPRPLRRLHRPRAQRGGHRRRRLVPARATSASSTPTATSPSPTG